MSSSESTYPIKCVIYGPARSGKTRTLDVVRVLNRDRVMRDDVNTLDELRAAELEHVEVITTESVLVMYTAMQAGASGVSLVMEDD